MLVLASFVALCTGLANPLRMLFFGDFIIFLALAILKVALLLDTFVLDLLGDSSPRMPAGVFLPSHFGPR